MINSSIGGIIFLLKHTTKARTSIMSLFDVDRLTKWTFALLIILQGWIFIILWMGIIFFASIFAIFNFSAQSVVQMFKRVRLYSNPMYGKANDLKDLILLLFAYKQFHLCIMQFNEIFRPYFLLLVSNGLTGLSVIPLTLVIGYHQHIHVPTLLTISLIFIVSTLSLIILYHECGNLNDGSMKFLKHLKRNIAWAEVNKGNKVLLLLYVRTLRPVKIQYSLFGYYKKQNSPRIITRVLYYSVKGIMTLKQII